MRHLLIKLLYFSFLFSWSISAQEISADESIDLSQTDDTGQADLYESQEAIEYKEVENSIEQEIQDEKEIEVELITDSEESLESELIATEYDKKPKKNKFQSRLEELDSPIGFEADTRLFVLYDVTSSDGSTSTEFSLSKARFHAKFFLGKVASAVLKLELRHIIRDKGSDSLRDVYIEFTPVDWLNFRVGQFKRPFSRIQLSSSTRLPLIERGRAYDYISEYLMYGDRDLGFALFGSILKKGRLDYELGLFNGLGRNTFTTGDSGLKDFVGRLESRVNRHLTFGASISTKYLSKGDLEAFFDPEDFRYISDPDFPIYMQYEPPVLKLEGFKDDHEWMTGGKLAGSADVRIRISDFEAIVDGMIAENWWFQQSPYVWSVASILTYEFKPKSLTNISFEPVLGLQVLTLTDENFTWRARMWELRPALNIHLGPKIRLMLQGEFVFVNGSDADFEEVSRRGRWPGEWPGSFKPRNSFLLQFTFVS